MFQNFKHQQSTEPAMSTNTKFCDEDITLTYNYSGAEKEHVLACKNRPFAVLCSTNLPTPSSSLIDHNLVRELGLKMTNLQCKKIVFLGRKFVEIARENIDDCSMYQE